MCVCMRENDVDPYFLNACDDYVEYSALIYTLLLISFGCPVILACVKM